MKKIHKLISVAVVILLTAGTLQASDRQKKIDTVLNLGEQMSNLVNMLETYALIGLSVSYATPVKRLKNGITDYDMMLINLETGHKEKAIQESIAHIRDSWRHIRRALYGVLVLTDKKTMKLNSAYINRKMRLAIDELNDMKNFLLQKVNTKNKEYIDAAILVGVSAERLSSNYMMKIWGVDDPDIKKYWDENLKTFEHALALLQSSPFAQQDTFRGYLAKSRKEFKYFTVLFGMNMRVPALVHKKAIKVTKDSHQMIKLILKDR